MLKSLNVLYAENENIIHGNIKEALEFMSMKVTSVSNGEEAYKEYLKNKPDILIADIEIPVFNGLELAEKIRQKDKDIQIIIATKSTDLEYLLKAVELNLVKYLLKPISLNDLKNTLTICIENLRYKSERLNKYFNDKDYYNLSEQRLYINEKIVKLDFHERDLLELLLKNHKRIVPYTEIEKKIWGGNMSSAAIRSLVRNLRKKLPPNVIENISKTGYKIIISD